MLLAKDATFEQILHKGSANTATGFSAMMKKDKVAQQAAVDQYFQHWDGKDAKNESAEEREVSLQCLPSGVRWSRLTSSSSGPRLRLRLPHPAVSPPFPYPLTHSPLSTASH